MQAFEFTAPRIGSSMNAIFLSAPTKSLRKITHSRYNRFVENYAQAPQRRLFHFPGPLLAFTRAAKPFIFSSLHALEFGLSATYSFSSTFALFLKRRGGAPKLPILEPPSCSRARFPERGPFHLILASPHQLDRTRHRRTHSLVRDANPWSAGPNRFSLAIKKQSAPHSTETHLRLTTFSGYSRTRTAIPQETDR
jgi:hypothetical protein